MKIPFESSPRSSLGVEWELQLVDRETRELRSGANEILETLSPGAEHPKAKRELLQSCVEVITGVCGTVPEAMADLAATVVPSGTVTTTMLTPSSGPLPYSSTSFFSVS